MKYDSQTLTDYLLGTLPEGDAEHLDELSLVDDAFAEELSAVEMDLVDRYEAGELPDTELSAFASHYASSPLRRQKIEFAAAFRAYAEGRTLAPNNVKGDGVTVEPIREHRWFARGWFPVMAYTAAILVVAIAGAWLVLGPGSASDDVATNLQPQGQPARDMGSPAPTSNMPERVVETVPANNTDAAKPRPTSEEPNTNIPRNVDRGRKPGGGVLALVLSPPRRGGAGQIPALTLSGEATDVSVALMLESDEYAAYRVVLKNGAGAILWQSGSQKAAGASMNRALNLRFPAKLLTDGFYSLEVSGVSNGQPEVLSDYAFKAVGR